VNAIATVKATLNPIPFMLAPPHPTNSDQNHMQCR
jgi:hypothetical protein